jgi:hypothetical protein
MAVPTVKWRVVPIAAACLLAAAPVARADLFLDAEVLVEAGGVAIDLPGYSVPSFVDWNDDDIPDLVVGQGSGSTPARVRVYLNTGTANAPAFTDYFYAQSLGDTLEEVGSG